MQDELLQIDGAAEEGDGGRSHRVGVVHAKFVNGVDSEGTEERERSRIDFRKLLDIHPVTASEIEGPDLCIVGRKQPYGVDGIPVIGDYVERRPFCAFEQGFGVDIAL